MFYERVKNLCKQRGISLTNVVKELGMSSGNLSKWKQGIVPKADTINALAEYFNVTADYLIGKQEVLDVLDNQTLTLSAKEVNLILKYRSLDAEGQTMVDSAVIAETRRMATKGEEEVNAG